MAEGDDKKDDKKDEKKEDEEEKDEEVEEDEEGDDDEDDDTADDGREIFSQDAKDWSYENFQDHKHMKYFEIAKDLKDDPKELDKPRTWLVQIAQVHYQHLWPEPTNNDVFLEFNIAYDYDVVKVRDRRSGTTSKKRVGSKGATFYTPYLKDLSRFEESEYIGYDERRFISMSYFDMHMKSMRVCVWDYNRMKPNMLLGSDQVEMTQICQGNVKQQFVIDQIIITKKKGMITKEVKNVGIVKFSIICQELMPYELKLQRWGARLNTKVLESSTPSTQKEEAVVKSFKPIIRFTLEQRFGLGLNDITSRVHRNVTAFAMNNAPQIMGFFIGTAEASGQGKHWRRLELHDP